MLPHYCKKLDCALGLPTGQNALKSNFFCQQNLTENPKRAENRDTYFFSVLQMGALGKLADGAKMLGAMTALATPLAAQEQAPVVLASAAGVNAQVTDCVGFVKEQRALAKEAGMAMSRSQQKGLLLDCQNGVLEARIAEQRKILETLGTEIAALDLRLDEQARILDANNQEIARIVAINGQLVIQIRDADNRIAALQADTAAKLAEAERILQALATS